VLEKNHFEGQKNIGEGSRNGKDLILTEILNQQTEDITQNSEVVSRKQSIQVSAPQTGTAAEQTIAHTMLDETGVAVIPTATFPVIMDDNGGSVAFTEGTHTDTELKYTAPTDVVYKVISIY